MNAIGTAVAAVLACLPIVAAADVYTWKDPQTGRTRMTSSPPPWLREGRPGPRVEVIRENRVIDAGTAIANPQPPAQMSERQRALGSPSVDTVFKAAAAPTDPAEGD